MLERDNAVGDRDYYTTILHLHRLQGALYKVSNIQYIGWQRRTIGWQVIGSGSAIDFFNVRIDDRKKNVV